MDANEHNIIILTCVYSCSSVVSLILFSLSYFLSFIPHQRQGGGFGQLDNIVGKDPAIIPKITNPANTFMEGDTLRSGSSFPGIRR